MSVKASARVWAGSHQTGTDLLMLLAIADFADDEGHAFPSVPRLADMCRTTQRHAHRIIANLRASGELEVKVSAGPKGTNRYRLAFDRMTRTSPLTQTSPLTPTSQRGDVEVPKPLTPTSPEPSLNRQEPRAGVRAGARPRETRPRPVSASLPDSLKPMTDEEMERSTAARRKFFPDRKAATA